LALDVLFQEPDTLALIKDRYTAKDLLDLKHVTDLARCVEAYTSGDSDYAAAEAELKKVSASGADEDDEELD